MIFVHFQAIQRQQSLRERVSARKQTLIEVSDRHYEAAMSASIKVANIFKMFHGRVIPTEVLQLIEDLLTEQSAYIQVRLEIQKELDGMSIF